MITFRHLASALVFCISISIVSGETRILTDKNQSPVKKAVPFQIIFDEAVVPAEKVGSNADPGFISSKPSLEYSAQWTAQNVLSVTPTENIPFKAEYTWSTASKSVFLSGKPIPKEIGVTKGIQSFALSWSTWLGQSRITTSKSTTYVFETNGIPLAARKLTNAYFKSNDLEKPDIVPARMGTPAYGEIKNYYEYARRLNDWGAGYRDDEAVPCMAAFTPSRPLIPGKIYTLFFSDGKDAYSNNIGEVETFTLELDYNPGDQSTSSDAREMTLNFSIPVEITDIKALFTDHLKIFADNAEAVNEEGKAAKTVKTNGHTFTFYLDDEWLEKRQGKTTLSQIPLMVLGDDPFACKVTIEHITAIDGQKLPAGQQWARANIKMKSPELYLNVGSNGMLYTGNKTIGVSMENIDKLNITAMRVSPEYGFKALNAYSRYYESSGEGRKTTSLANEMKLVPMEMLASDEAEKDKAVPVKGKKQINLTLDSIYGEQLQPGMYFIEIEGAIIEGVIDGYKRFGLYTEDGKLKEFDKDEASLVAQTVIQLTDIGVLIKKTARDVFVYSYSLSTGKPLETAKVEVADKNGRILGSSEIKQGICQMNLPQEAALIRISNGADSLISKLKDYETTIGLWYYDISTPIYAFKYLNIAQEDYEARRLFTFTDRSLYKPGETVQMKGIARIQKGNDILPIKDDHVVLSVVSPNNTTISTRKIKLSEYGSFDFTYELPEENVGRYEFSIEFPGENGKTTPEDDEDGDDGNYYTQRLDKQNRHFSQYVKVEEFRRNAFEISSQIETPQPGAAKISIESSAVNYTGVPLANTRIDWTLTATPTNFYPSGYRDFLFGDHRDYDYFYWKCYYGFDDSGYYDSNRKFGSSEGKLDEEGKTKAELVLPRFNTPRALGIDVVSRVTDENQQSLSEKKTTTVHPASVYVGIRSKGYTHATGAPLPIDLLAVGIDGKPCPSGVKVDIQAKREEFTPYRYMNDGTTTVKNEPTIETVYSGPAEIPASPNPDRPQPATIMIPAEKPGIYTVTVTGQDSSGNEFYSAVRIYAYGGDYSPWEYSDGMKIKIIPDKPLYHAGDKAKILIQTPIEGEIIATVEREKMIRYYTQRITLEDTTVEIPIEEGDAPNAYVSIFLVKGANESAREYKEPQLKLGYCTLNVQPTGKTLKVSLEAPEESVLPGSPTVINGSITDSKGNAVANAEVTLYVEDEGTLAVIGYETPNPVNYFYADRDLDITTLTSLNNLIGEDSSARQYDNKGIFVGGGGEDAFASDSLSENLLRKDFNPCACWIASVKTDAQGRFKAEYNNPHTLTRYRVIAVAAAGECFGSGDTFYVVNKPVMLEPSPPMFANEGDTLEIPVTISKTTDRQGKWIVSMTSNDIAKVETAPQVVTIPDKGSITAHFSVSFINTGEAALAWSIQPADDEGNALTDPAMAKLTDRLEHTFTVEFPAPLLREEHHFTGDKAVQINSLLSKELSQDNAKMELAISSSPMIFAGGSIHFLLDYPYGCLEQKTSKMIPWIFADTLAKYTPDFPAYTPEKRLQTLHKFVTAILAHQDRWTGALSYWASDKRGENSQFTPYAVLSLLLCQEQGVDIPAETLDKIWTNWKEILKKDEKPFNPYMACWVMTKGKAMTEAELNLILDHAQKLSRADAYYLALAVLESGRADARRLAPKIVAHARDRETSCHDTAIIPCLEVMYLSKLDPRSGEASNAIATLMMNKTKNASYRYNTWASGWETLAIGYYLSALPDRPHITNIDLTISGKTETIKLPENGQAVKTAFTFKDGASIGLCLDKPQENTDKYFYANLSASCKPRSMTFDAVTDKGFAITRVYCKLDENRIWQPSLDFKVGDIVQVRLEASKGADAGQYLVVEDYLPAAFEPINPGLTSQSGGVIPSGYQWNQWVDNVEFYKNKVAFFANNWYGNIQFRATYLARVTKAGTVTAPPAKIELMYQPQIYGLTLNQKLTVEPKDNERE